MKNKAGHHYICPMHPEQTSSRPGKCAVCHMALEKQKTQPQSGHNHTTEHSHNEHGKHAGHSTNMFKRKFWLSLLLTLPILYMSETMQELLGFKAINIPNPELISALLGTAIFVYGGLVFLKSARAEVAMRSPGMMTLISLAITVAFVYSWAVTAGLIEGRDFWWELSSLITVMLLGHWLEMASVSNAQGALKELAKLLPDTAELIAQNGTKTVPVSQLKIGDKILIKPGTSIPADGVVLEGEAKIDESMLTGESKPVRKKPGSPVYGGTINIDGALTVKVTQVGEDTMLSGIMRLVAEAQASKSRTQLLADKAAGMLFYFAVASAFVAAVGWGVFAQAETSFVLERVVTVLVIACPHALGLAVPLVGAISTAKAAQSGILVRDRSELEMARKTTTILFDKTGTLTTGKQGVVKAALFDKNALSIAAAIEANSSHPIARAITEYAKASGTSPKKATKFRIIEGKGVSAQINNKTYFIGGPNLLKDHDVSLQPEAKKLQKQAEQNAQAIVYLFNQHKQILAVFLIADQIRPEAKEAISQLKKLGKKVAMLTGDNQAVARWVAKELGINKFYAEVLPQDKTNIVKQLQSEGEVVAFVGDGINDAPALVQADVGIAIGAGTNIAIESAGIVLISNDPRGVIKVINLSQKTYIKMLQNLFWAAGYNVIAIPLAGGAFAFTGFVLSPAVGAILMSLSTVIVAFNAQLLRRAKI